MYFFKGGEVRIWTKGTIMNSTLLTKEEISRKSLMSKLDATNPVMIRNLYGFVIFAKHCYYVVIIKCKV